jgi:hypothetical protein
VKAHDEALDHRPDNENTVQQQKGRYETEGGEGFPAFLSIEFFHIHPGKRMAEAR